MTSRSIRILSELTKARITLFVAITGGAGYILFKSAVDIGILAPCVGLFLLACGSAALNQYQERKVDALMARTKERPIPAGAISPLAALQIVVVLIVAGSLCLLWGGTPLALGLGLLALVWYNGIYLVLKRSWAFAVVPGSLVGALGPMIGWTAAGGPLWDPKIVTVALFFFIWQIPHFWLLLLKYGKEYEAAGYPSLTQTFSLGQIRRLTFIWLAATVVTSLFIPFLGGVSFRITALALAALGVILVARAFIFLRRGDDAVPVHKAFMDINLYALAVTVVLSLDTLLA